jgi:hypothetical protein
MHRKIYKGLRGPVTRHSANVALLLATMMISVNSDADERRNCFSITSASPALVTSGDILRRAMLQAAVTKVNGDTALTAVAAPTSPTRCTGVNASIPTAAPTAANYYGTVTNKTKFRRFVGTACGGGAITGQYFSMGKAIYYRSCAGGAGNNYIYFWGKQDGNSSTCFGSTYPEMYTLANSVKTNPVTAARMNAVIDGTGLTEDTQPGYALGNMMAAILISEAARDYLVIPENYILMNKVTAGTNTPEQLIGGHCIPSATGCGNTAAKQDGVHPLAWGGALGAMMTGGGWGTTNGATSDFGMAYESDLVVGWLKGQNKITVSTTTQCTGGNPAAPQLQGLFDSLF